jgi:transposase
VIMPSHKVRIFVASDPVDFRKGHDGLAALVQSQLRQKPFDGSVYVFRSKRADRLKLIYWDGSGLVMACKRLEDNSLSYDFPWLLGQKGATARHAIYGGQWRRLDRKQLGLP